jgi:pimeloyl-ACP methyl ester carboxylesterase
MPIVGQPGERAFVTTTGAEDGWRSLMPTGFVFDNAMMPSLALSMLRYRPARLARKITCPLLVTVSERETLMDPAIAIRAAAHAPRGRALLADADHFDVYYSPLFDHLVAEHATFLRQHLGLG